MSQVFDILDDAITALKQQRTEKFDMTRIGHNGGDSCAFLNMVRNLQFSRYEITNNTTEHHKYTVTVTPHVRHSIIVDITPLRSIQARSTLDEILTNGYYYKTGRRVVDGEVRYSPRFRFVWRGNVVTIRPTAIYVDETTTNHFARWLLETGVTDSFNFDMLTEFVFLPIVHGFDSNHLDDYDVFADYKVDNSFWFDYSFLVSSIDILKSILASYDKDTINTHYNYAAKLTTDRIPFCVAVKKK